MRIYSLFCGTSAERVASRDRATPPERRATDVPLGHQASALRSLLTDGNPVDLVELKQVVPQGCQSVTRERTLCAADIRQLRDIFEMTTSDYEGAPNRRTATRPLLRAMWICLGTSCPIGELLQSLARNSDCYFVA